MTRVWDKENIRVPDGNDWKQTMCKNVHISIACIVPNLPKKETSNSLEALLNRGNAHSIFVAANKKNWIFFLEQISPSNSARPLARSGKEIRHYLLFNPEVLIENWTVKLRSLVCRVSTWEHDTFVIFHFFFFFGECRLFWLIFL